MTNIKPLNRIIVFALAFVMILGSFAGGFGSLGVELAMAETTVITTNEAFAAMEPGGNYELGADITITEPYGQEFCGTFDGKGHTITLNITSETAYTGLFSKLTDGESVKNLIIDGKVCIADNSTKSYCGAIAGSANASANAVNIKNCWNKATVSGYKAVGGIAGITAGAVVIESCANTGTVLGRNNQIGGIVGNISSGSTIIRNCYNMSNVTGFSYAGGIVGQATKSSASPTIQNCYSTGNYTLTGLSSPVGGLLIGLMSTAGSVSNCFALGTQD